MQNISFEFREAKPEEIDLTSRALLEHSQKALGMDVDFKPFGLLAHENSTLVGSVIGKIFLGWLHVDLIWVDTNHRRKGLGTRLMAMAAHKAREIGLTGIEVWTQNWQAPEFYRKLGYEEFAVLDDFTPGNKRHAFRFYLQPQNAETQIGRMQPLPDIIRSHVKAYFRLHGDTLPSSGIYDRLMPFFEKPLIETTLEATKGNQIKAAKLLGINRNTLRKKITTLGITPSRKNA